VTSVQSSVLVRPSFSSATSSQECRIVIAEHYRLVHTAIGKAKSRQIAVPTVGRARCKEAPMFNGTARLQHLAARTFKGIVLCVITKAAHRHGATDWLCLCRNNRFDRALLHTCEHLSVRLAGVGRCRFDRRAGHRGDRVETTEYDLPRISLACGDLHI